MMRTSLLSATLAAIALTASTAHAQRVYSPGSPTIPAPTTPSETSAQRVTTPPPGIQPSAQPAPLSLRNGAVSTGLTGYYDYQSNGMSPNFIVVDPNDRMKVHATYMLSLDQSDLEGAAPNRRVGYAYSNDGGATWKSTREIATMRLGFPSLDVFSDGSAYIVTHGDDGGLHTMMYASESPGGTSFIRLGDLPQSTQSGKTKGVIWPTYRFTKDYSKAIVLGSYSNDAAASEPQAPLQVAVLDLSSGTAANGWRDIADSQLCATSGGRDVIARSNSGKLGAAWYRFGSNADDDAAGLYYAESNDNGATWGAPVKVHGGQIIDDPNLNLNGDPDTLLGGTQMDLAFIGDVPHIVYEGSINSLFLYESIFHWTPATGVTAIGVANLDSGRGAQTMSRTTTQSNMSSIAYPTISVGSDGQHIAVCYSAVAQLPNAARDSLLPVVNEEGFNYYRLWMVGSMDGGATWGDSRVIQDFGGGGADSASIEYPSLAEHGFVDTDGKFELSLAFQARRQPGMYTFIPTFTDGTVVRRGTPNETGLYYQRTKLTDTWFKVFTTSVDNHRELNVVTSIAQVSPNPASNFTTLQFELPKSGTYSIEVVNALGQKVATLVDREPGIAGGHTRTLDVSNLGAGGYRLVLSQNGTVVTHPLNVVR